MESSTPVSHNHNQALRQQLARTARRQFVENVCLSLPHVDGKILEFLSALMQQPGTVRDMQERRDTLLSYEAERKAWLEQTAQAWREGLMPQPAASKPSTAPAFPSNGLELLSDDVVENRLLASRLALAMLEHFGATFTEVRRRTEYLQGSELAEGDIVRGETLCLRLVEQWLAVGMSRNSLHLVLDALRAALMEVLLEQYQALLELYDRHGIEAPTTLRVLRPVGASNTTNANTGMGSVSDHPAPAPMTTLQHMQHMQHMQQSAGLENNHPVAILGTTLAQARERAQGIMLQLHRLIESSSNAPSAAIPPTKALPTGQLSPASAALEQALAAQRVHTLTHGTGVGPLFSTPSAGNSAQAVVEVASLVRQRTEQLKKKTDNDGEKAIIEVVALMFQSILDEARIPAEMRVWLARLQVPVLRVALLEPDFFNNSSHPARQLIDRIGGCVLGFDSGNVDASALAAEIRRVVQVIEQYPESGRRVFELVLAEFEKFLATFLTEKQETSQIVSVAQQVEQKEALAIQYTIGLRSMLENMPVPDDIREFLFKHWSEVLAISTVRSGAQHPDTLAFKHLATELVASVGAKNKRAERAKIIENLPTLIGNLRRGLTLAGVIDEQQDRLIQTITNMVAAAFFSKTASIPQNHIDDLTHHLVHLENVMDEDGLGDMPLNAENLEMLLGIDASHIYVIADHTETPEPQVLNQALALPRGAWFTLEYQGRAAQVQYAWHSERKQLHLFAATDGSSWLIQLRSLAACLANGTLVAQERESLTQRAAREALSALDAHPERILE